ncbi:MAG: dihydrodipicolinate synthase family protein [Micromonosporaceae bacterium]
MISPGAAALRDRLRWTLVAAAATPADSRGQVDLAVLERYFQGLIADGAGGLAVLAHTGRGPYWSADLRRQVISVAVGCGVPVIVGVGGRPGETTAEVAAAAVQAADVGADGLLVFPPGPASDAVTRFDAVAGPDVVTRSDAVAGSDAVVHHDAVWRESGLPMLGFDLYTRPYPPGALAALLDHPGVAGVKVARLHDAIACQAAITTTRAADRLSVTGEDRMFGGSLMWGAEAALVGVAAAAVPVTARVFTAYQRGAYAEFVAASARLDRLAAATFTEPMEGYVQRMLWIAAAERRIPVEYAVDPYGPELPDGERARVLRAAS